MSNKHKQHFTGEMIKRSKLELDKNPNFKKDLEEFFKKPEMVNLTPEKHSKNVMYFFQNANLIRPEILLDRNDELSKTLFKDEVNFNSFKNELTTYQDNEQVLLSNRKNGLKISELALDENNIMPFLDPEYALEPNKKNVKTVGKLLDKSYKNIGVMGNKSKYTLFSNIFTKNFDDQELDNITIPDFEPLKNNTFLDLPEDQNIGFMVGAKAPEIENNLLNNLTNLDKFEPTTSNIKDLENGNKDPLSMKKQIEADIKERIGLYEVDSNREGDFYGIKGKRKFNIEKGAMGSNRAYGGLSPDKDTIVDMLLLVKHKNILQFPYSEENVEQFKQAMAQIKQDNLFDLKEITFAKTVDPAFKNALNEVMNNQMILGAENGIHTDDLDFDLDVENNEVKPDVNKDEVKPDVKKDEVKPDVKKDDVKPDIKKDEVKPDVKKLEAENTDLSNLDDKIKRQNEIDDIFHPDGINDLDLGIDDELDFDVDLDLDLDLDLGIDDELDLDFDLDFDLDLGQDDELDLDQDLDFDDEIDMDYFEKNEKEVAETYLNKMDNEETKIENKLSNNKPKTLLNKIEDDRLSLLEDLKDSSKPSVEVNSNFKNSNSKRSGFKYS